MSAIITDRERALFAGHHEFHGHEPFRVALYWEPHYEPDERGHLKLVRSFTVDIVLLHLSDLPRRYRFRTLAEADEKIAELVKVLAVEIAKLAFRIN